MTRLLPVFLIALFLVIVGIPVSAGLFDIFNNTPNFLIIEDGIVDENSFTDLNDTPDSYSGQAGKFLKVDAGETSLIFVNEPAGGGGFDGNAASICDGNTALTGDGDCVIITGFDTGGVGGSGDLNDAYNSGSVVSVPNTDVEWILGGAGSPLGEFRITHARDRANNFIRITPSAGENFLAFTMQGDNSVGWSFFDNTLQNEFWSDSAYGHDGSGVWGIGTDNNKGLLFDFPSGTSMYPLIDEGLNLGIQGTNDFNSIYSTTFFGDLQGTFDGNASTFYIDWQNHVNRLFSLIQLDNNSNFDARYVNTTGDTMTGNLTVPNLVSTGDVNGPRANYTDINGINYFIDGIDINTVFDSRYNKTSDTNDVGRIDFPTIANHPVNSDTNAWTEGFLETDTNAILQDINASKKLTVDGNALFNSPVDMNGFATGNALAGQYDLTVGVAGAGGGGCIKLGDYEICDTGNMGVVGALNLDNILIFRDMNGDSNIFAMFITPGDKPRFVIPKEGVDFATYNSRSMMVGGDVGEALDDDIILCSANGYDMLACNTDLNGADFGVQNDAQIRGTLFVDESIRAALDVNGLKGHFVDFNISSGNLFVNSTVYSIGDDLNKIINAETQCDEGEVFLGQGTCVPLAGVNFQAQTIETIVGTEDSGDVNSVQVIDDGDTYEVSEVTGTPGFTVDINFVNVDNFNIIQLHTFYNGSLGHNIDVELLNFSSGNHDDFGSITDQTGFTFTMFDVVNDTVYINGSGGVSLRLNHSNAGNPTHDLNIDFAALRFAQGGVAITDHGAMGDLEQQADHMYAVTVDGSRPFTANWYAGPFVSSFFDLNTGSGNIRNNALIYSLLDLNRSVISAGCSFDQFLDGTANCKSPYLLDGTQALTGDFNLGASTRDFNYGTSVVFRTVSQPNAVDFLKIINQPTPDGISGPTLTVDGLSVNADIHIKGKGTGVVKADSNVSIQDENALIFRDNQLGLYSPIDGQLNIFADGQTLIESNLSMIKDVNIFEGKTSIDDLNATVRDANLNFDTNSFGICFNPPDCTVFMIHDGNILTIRGSG